MKRSDAVKLLHTIIRNGMASDHRVEVAYSNILQDIEDILGLEPPKATFKIKDYDDIFGDPFYISRKWEAEDEKK